MDPYDKEKTRQIWKRVLGEDCMGEVRATDSEQLRRMIAAEKTAACIYRRLASCVKQGDVLRQIAKEELCHSRQLEAIYYLWTGEQAEAVSEALPKYACAAQALRQLHRQELDTANTYRQAAEELPEHRDVFLCMAKMEQKHAAQLFCLLQHCIG